MDKDTQLPAEVENEIESFADKCTANLKMDTEYHIGYNNGMEAGVIAGATEYAIKLHQCDKSNKALEEKNRELVERNTVACNLLKELISSKSFPKLLNWNLFEKIKTFLDGAK